MRKTPEPEVKVAVPMEVTEIDRGTLFLHEVLASGTFKLQGKDVEYQIWLPIPPTCIILYFGKGDNKRMLHLGLRDIMDGFMEALDRIDKTQPVRDRLGKPEPVVKAKEAESETS